MSHNGIYLYGFAEPELTRDFWHPGHEEISPVQVLEIEGLAVFVSTVPPGLIESGLSLEPPNPDWIVPRALHHERVLEAVLDRTPVLPVRFGCVFRSAQAVEEVAKQHHEMIRSFLREIADQEEWSLKGYLDESQAIDSLLHADPVLAERYQELPAAPGTRYFLEKQLREEARRRTIKAGKRSADRLFHLVQRKSTKVQALPVREGDEVSRQLLLKLAILVKRARRDELFGELEEAARAREPVPLVIEKTGPWPAYHFCPNLGEPSP